MSYGERFWSKVSGGDVSECWLWTAQKNSYGYGRFSVAGRHRLAHRLSYEMLIGEVPPGLDLDHLCRVRDCVNPWHLEPVTRTVNILRGAAPAIVSARHAAVTHCPKGHPYDEENTYRPPGKKAHRMCRICGRERQRLRAGIQ